FGVWVLRVLSGVICLKVPELERLQHGAGAISYAKLGQDAGRMVLDRSLGGAERIRNFAVAVAARHQTQYLQLAFRERVGRTQRLELAPHVLESAQHTLGHCRPDQRAAARRSAYYTGQC